MTPFVPGADDASRLADARLMLSPAVALVRERWALLASRAAILATAGERAVAVPAAHEAPRWWLLTRVEGGIAHHALAALEGELLALLTETTVGDALAVLEERCSEVERAQLPMHAQRWLAASVARGVWAGARYDEVTEE